MRSISFDMKLIPSLISQVESVVVQWRLSAHYTRSGTRLKTCCVVLPTYRGNTQSHG